MPFPWIPGVQKTGNLTVFPGAGLLSAAAWGNSLFTKILTEYNRLAQTNLFGVRLVRSNTAPDNHGGGANVQLEISNGTHTFFDSSGNPTTGTLNVTPGQMHGITHLVTFGAGASMKVAKAFVFVPINPMLPSGSRGIGIGPKMGLTLHELFHASGLDAADPGHQSAVGGGDIWMTNAVVQAGSTPDQDKYVFSSGMQPDASGQFTLAGNTVGLVQDVWLYGQY